MTWSFRVLAGVGGAEDASHTPDRTVAGAPGQPQQGNCKASAWPTLLPCQAPLFTTFIDQAMTRHGLG
jgi:hypothetical protein